MIRPVGVDTLAACSWMAHEPALAGARKSCCRLSCAQGRRVAQSARRRCMHTALGHAPLRVVVSEQHDGSGGETSGRKQRSAMLSGLSRSRCSRGRENSPHLGRLYHRPEAIYEVHPFVQEKLASLLGVVPQVKSRLGAERIILHDLRRAIRFLPLVMSFCMRMPFRVAGRTVSFVFRLMDAFASQHKSFRRLVQAPEIRETFDEMISILNFKRMKAFLDPLPLLARLGEQIDLQKVLASPIVWHIITERVRRRSDRGLFQ